MAKWGKLSFAQKKCVSTIGMLMQKTEMVSEGSRVGIAVSGGVDSFVLIRTMLIRQAIMPFNIELMVLHLNPGFDPENHIPLSTWCSEHGVSSHIELTDFGPRAHSPENRKNSACFYCSRLRRKRLFELCDQYNLTHLALGHNADDLVTTFFMNMLQNGRVDGLSANEPFFKGKLQMIRPALMLEKKFIKTAARQWGLPIWANDCPSNGTTKRNTINSWVYDSWKKDPRIMNNIINALKRWQLDLNIKTT
ncbi:tRNA lysidine(34) synthetase [Maridesulfovibrio bastinii]|uniref:tRNA lysidine(34) synthetase n=1 Tax=Maridesulfovibrio bastinii TaxID=47157 RepID=UPI00040A9BA8|nr:tRNA 2-thiocytidine biosynthesis TtcA family protein [Maridesulfovibrio bastinii]